MKRIKRAALGILAGALVGTGAVTGVMAFTPVQASAEAPDYMPSKNIMTPTKLEFNKSYKKSIRGDKDGSYYYFTTDSSSKPYTIEIFNDVDSNDTIRVKCYEMNADSSNQKNVLDNNSGYFVDIGVNNRFQKTLEKGTLKPNCEYMIQVQGYWMGWKTNPISDNKNYIAHFKIHHETDASDNIVKKVNGSWIYYKNGQPDYTFTGAAKSTKGNWIFVKNGRYDTGFTGVAKSTKGNWIFMKNGRYNTSFTGAAKSTKGNWIYVKNGRYTTSFTGIATSTKGNRLYMSNGRWQNNFTGRYGSYYIKKGYVV